MEKTANKWIGAQWVKYWKRTNNCCIVEATVVTADCVKHRTEETLGQQLMWTVITCAAASVSVAHYKCYYYKILTWHCIFSTHAIVTFALPHTHTSHLCHWWCNPMYTAVHNPMPPDRYWLDCSTATPTMPRQARKQTTWLSDLK